MAAGSRTKNQQSKAQQAHATRQRITAAASELFVRDGFLTTTMAGIAGEAGVAVQTLYLAFGNKTAILRAAVDHAIGGDDEPIPVLERPWWQEMTDEPDGPRALTVFINSSGEIIRRLSPLYQVVRAAAADPEVGEILDRNKHERHAGFAAVVDQLSRKPGFSKTLSVDDATGVLYAVQSEESYALLVEEHGWGFKIWRDWALRTVTAELFPKPARAR